MRWSNTLIPTLRDDPQEAEIPSHRLMLRAGLIRRVSGGLYTFLPLGLRILHKIERIVREEMDRAGALEVLMPALQPRELWDRSGRYEVMGDVMFRLRDRQERQMVLGPTHEEVITDMVAHEIRSYRQLPRTFYQIQTKFRDEIRPRFGLMRAKEFIMKDAYSFDVGWSQADASYQAMYDAYVRIFNRCGLETKVVEADTGAMGGKWSHEFMVLADTGEDGIIECESCAYAANLERAELSFKPVADGLTPAPTGGPMEEVSTPGMKTIEQVSGFLKSSPGSLLKTVIYMLGTQAVAVVVPGDRTINEHKLRRALEAPGVEMADDATVLKITGAPVGFAGPAGLNIPVYADLSLQGRRGAVAGANKSDTHVLNVDLDRDARVTGYFDLCVAREGDRCPRCDARMREKRGIEVGHVFKLGTKYSESLGALYLDETGQQKPAVMGCYGIGVTRTLQAIVEQRWDENGIVWPLSVAPYRVVVIVLSPQHAESMQAADSLMTELSARGIDAILDDRDDRPGVKFKDADLVGFPVRVVIGEKGLAKGAIEVKLRTGKASDLIPRAAAVDHIVGVCS